MFGVPHTDDDPEVGRDERDETEHGDVDMVAWNRIREMVSRNPAVVP